MNILYVTQKFPYPLNDGGNIRSFHILKQLAKKHSVSLISTVSDKIKNTDLAVLKKICNKVTVFPEPKGGRLLLTYSLFRSLIGKYPYFMYKNFSRQILSEICRQLRDKDYQAIHFNHIDTAIYVNYLPQNNIHTVLDSHNVLSLIVKRLYEQEKNTLKKKYIYAQWQKTVKIEKKLCEKMNTCLVCSDNDAAQLAKLSGKCRIEVIPNGVDLNRPALSAACDTVSLVYIGAMDYLPNYQAALYFCKDVLPIVQDKIPQIKFYIIGRNPIAAIRQLNNKDNIIILDKVANIRDCLNSRQILVVPLQLGGGTRLKILDAISYKLPVVSTSVGAEGLDLVSGKHIIIADRPDDMAKRIIKVCQNNTLRQRLIKNAYQQIERKYEWNIIGNSLLKVYNQL